MAAYRFSGYWKDVGTIVSFWDANMELLSVNSGVQLFDKSWPIYCRTSTLPPHVIGQTAKLSHSFIASGCEVHGKVENSVLFHSVSIAEGAKIRYSILMPGTVVEKDAVVEYSILAENTHIGQGAKIGAAPCNVSPDDWGVAVLGSGVSIPEHQVVPPKAMLESNEEEEQI